MYRRPAMKSSQEASKYQGFPGSGASFAGFSRALSRAPWRSSGLFEVAHRPNG